MSMERDVPIRVGLIGYGNAGRAVADQLARARGVSLEWIAKRSIPARYVGPSRVPIYSALGFSNGALFDFHPVDAVVDFSAPPAIHAYGQPAAVRGISIISAVTDYPEVDERMFAERAKQTVVMRIPSFSPGASYPLVAAALGNGILLALPQLRNRPSGLFAYEDIVCEPMRQDLTGDLRAAA